MGALVADEAHQLAGAVLEDRRADMRADGEVEPAQILFAVAIDRKAAQFDDAAAILEFVGDIVPQFAQARQPDICGRDFRPLHAAQSLERGIEFLADLGRQFADPTLGVLDVLAVPGGGTGEGARDC